MLERYVPTDDELAMAELKHVLRASKRNIATQEGLVATLVYDILNFDYHYESSDSEIVHRACDEMKTSIKERLNDVEDVYLQSKLSACFNVYRHKGVISLVPWGKYIDNVSEYVYLRWDGYSNEEVCYFLGVKKHIEEIVTLVMAGKIQGKVIYGNDLHAVQEAVNAGITWRYSEVKLVTAAISDELYVLIKEFVDWYTEGRIPYAALKALFGFNANYMKWDHNDVTMEVIRIRNFYFIVTH